MVVLFNTEQQAQNRINEISVLWLIDFPNDNLFQKYANVLRCGDKFGIPIEDEKYFTVDELARSVEFNPEWNNDELIIEVP